MIKSGSFFLHWLKTPNIISSYRVPHRENPAVSHILWWVMSLLRSGCSKVNDKTTLQKSNTLNKADCVLFLPSHFSAARRGWLLRRESHLHWHREHLVSSRWWEQPCNIWRAVWLMFKSQNFGISDTHVFFICCPRKNLSYK